jgi:hypothetical protein
LLSVISDIDEAFAAAVPQNCTPRSEEDRTEARAIIKPASATNLTGDNFRRERNFKLAVLDWLNDGRPKLFRSPGEGNYII